MHMHGPVNGCFTAYYTKHNFIIQGVIHDVNPDHILKLYLLQYIVSLLTVILTLSSMRIT